MLLLLYLRIPLHKMQRRQNLVNADCHWRSQKFFFRVEDNFGNLGDRSPPVRSRGEAPVEVWGQSPPEADDFMIIMYRILTTT